MENEIELTAEEQALLETEFPAEIEKQAEAQLASVDCVEALRTFGEAKAEAELFGAAGDEEGVKTALEKQASASEIIEEKMKAIRAYNFDVESELDEAGLDEVLVKEASAAAHVIAEGYFGEYMRAAEENPELVKIAKMNLKGAAKAVKKAGGKAIKYVSKGAKSASKGVQKAGKKSYKALKGAAGAGVDKVKDAGKAAQKHVKKNPKSYSALAGFGAGVGAKAAHDKAAE